MTELPEYQQIDTSDFSDATLESDQTIVEGEGLLARLESEDRSLEAEVSIKYGEKFSELAKEYCGQKWQKLLEQGDGFITWAEQKGLPLPQSKVGMRTLAGATGAVGTAVPGLGVLLPVAYILWKRSASLSTKDSAPSTLQYG